MTDQPIACTLPADRVTGRLALIGRLADDALLDRSPIPGGVRTRFRGAPGVERRLRELVALESQCCAFLDFRIAIDGDAIVIDVTGPPGAQPVIEQLLGDLRRSGSGGSGLAASP